MPLYVRRTKLRIRNCTFAIRDLIFRGGGGGGIVGSTSFPRGGEGGGGGGGGRILRITSFSRGAKWDQSSPTEYKGVTLD